MKILKFLLLVSFVFLSESIILDCTFDNLVVPQLGGSYHCDAKVRPGASKLIEQVNGVHKENKTTKDVTSLWVRYQTVTEIPKNLPTIFPKIKAIYLLGTNLKSVTAEDLRPFPELVFFGSASNNQTKLDSDLFKYNPILRGINFYNSSLQHAGLGVLKNLTNLKEVGLQKNPCIDKYTTDPKEIETLKENISVLCPPLDQKPPIDEGCKVRCSLEDEVEELLTTILEQNEKIVKLESRIAKIELQLRKIN